MSSSSASIETRHDREGPLMDDRGRYLCPLHAGSPQRIETKAERQRWGQGYAHQRCAKRVERAKRSSAAVATDEEPRLAPPQPRPVTPMPTQERVPTSQLPPDAARELASEEGAAAASMATLARGEPAVQPTGESSSQASLRTHFTRYGWVRVPSNETLRGLSWELLHLLATPIPSAASSTIAGKVKQTDLATLPGEDVQLFLRRWGQAVREIAISLGVDASSLYVVDPKLLHADPSTGEQAVHFDCARHPSAANKYSAILMCSNGCKGTALPVFESNDTLSFSEKPAEMKSVAHLLEKRQYSSEAAHPGDVVFFRQSTPHYGVRNELKKGSRIVLFSILSPSSKPAQDEHQVFPWLFVGAAFTWKSEEFARALVEGKAYDPVGRIAADQGVASQNIALNTLRQFGLLKSYQQK